MTYDFFPQEPIHYVHNPKIDKPESGTRMRKAAGERQLDKR